MNRILTAMLLALVATPLAAQSPEDIKRAEEQLAAFRVFEIKTAQEALADYGVGEADGIMSQETRDAIRAYESDWGFPVTGELTTELVERLVGAHPDTESHWYELEDQDCKLWNGDRRASEVITWTGGCLGGKASGQGVMTSDFVLNGETMRERYEGEYADGLRDGPGVFVWWHGDRCEGEWSKDKIDGQGVRVAADGSLYHGEFNFGEPDGRGTMVTAGGTKFEGQWSQGKLHGLVVATYPDGFRFESEWRDGSPHGPGTGVAADGTRYTGEDGCLSAGNSRWAVARDRAWCSNR